MARSRAHLRLVPDLAVVAPPTAPTDTSFHPGPVTPGRQNHRANGAGPEPLWRELLGAQLRARRHRRGERLADVAARAGVSPQYLSEIERGRKEPSSEMIGAIGRALGTDLAALTLGVGRDLRHGTAPGSGGATRPTSGPSGPSAQLRAA